MDFMSIPVVAKCCDISQDIRDYFLEERYLGEVDQYEALTPELVSVIAVNLLLDELAAIGLETNFTAEELLQSTMDRDIMFYLRQKFDKTNYYSFLRSLSEKEYSDFCGILEGCSVSQDLLIELTDFATAICPSDTAWEAINTAMDHWCSTREFGRHIAALQYRMDIHTDPNKTTITDNNIQEVCQFLQKMKQNDEQLAILSRFVAKMNGGRVNMIILNDLIKHYDRDKLNPDVLPLIAHYSANPTGEPPTVLKNHWKTTPHHVEYWKDKFERVNNTSRMTYIEPTSEEWMMFIFSAIIDGKFGEELIKKLHEFQPYMSSTNFDNMMVFATLYDWEKVIRGEEQK